MHPADGWVSWTFLSFLLKLSQADAADAAFSDLRRPAGGRVGRSLQHRFPARRRLAERRLAQPHLALRRAGDDRIQPDGGLDADAEARLHVLDLVQRVARTFRLEQRPE